MTELLQDNWASGLAELLEQQKRLYAQLAQLASRQADLVVAGQAETLLGVLSQRQALIDQLVVIHGRLDPYRQSWAEAWNHLDAAHQSHIETLIADVQQLLQQIVDQDERDRRALADQREQLLGSLHHVRRGTAANVAYSQPTTRNPDPRLTDQQG